MKRLIDHHLLQWKVNPHRKPLMLRGARQVGKTLLQGYWVDFFLVLSK